MPRDGIDHVTVLGAGNMGHGIAEVAAIAGYDVTMRDIEEGIVTDGYGDIEWSLGKLAESGDIEESPDAVLDRIDTTVDLAEAVDGTDFVVEAGPERMDVKRDIFGDLDEFAPADAILATNTSSLSITDISDATDSPERVVGTHFFNPPVRMELVEVIYGAETSDETAETAAALVESFGKTTIYVRKDVNGFVVNSVLGPYMQEPAWMVSAEEATVRGADATLVHERDYPMGPFELGDLTGIDIGYHVRREAGRPVPPIIEEKVEADDLGRKTGTGYYEYEDCPGTDYTAEDAGEFDWFRVEARMVNEAAKLVGDDVAAPEAVDTGMRLGTGFPEGPCRRGDRLGLERALETLRALHGETGEDRYEPADHLVELVESGNTGEEAGRGFHGYDGGT
ncbi:3-hydroxyacyl-CoA dehydrogenase [Halorarum halophilum]|uniref:3-hydroxyacyl-CoA dehydrogenase n=1 Tax=Halorarum halophilum TaxID=2743090 RepID=A0A7D5KFY9_9EURY|nr:3-hydroxyacyl-CoA dehydrogenase [Halobaculum halophilum]QLG29357.1 3-hydroxyacyl-CoA dehydrogenase [Halobaculum halophilum]